MTFTLSFETHQAGWVGWPLSSRDTTLKKQVKTAGHSDSHLQSRHLETEARGLPQTQGQPGLQREKPCFQNTQTNNNRRKTEKKIKKKQMQHGKNAKLQDQFWNKHHCFRFPY